MSFQAPFDPLCLLILKFRGRRVAVFRDHCADYESIIAVARRSLRPLQLLGPDAGDLILLASIPGYPDASEVEVAEEVWPTVSPIVHSVTIAFETEILSAFSESEYGSTAVSPDFDDGPGPVWPLTRPPFSSTFSVPGRQVAQDELVGRKPVIYLFPPSRLSNVTVELLLTSSWSFSAIYPLPQTAITSGEKQQIAPQSLTWTIDTEPDGRLVDKTSGVEVSYLYWEATANSRLITPDSSRATTPVEEDIEAFDPSRPSLSPGDSVLLSIDKIPSYLDAALKALTLHTEARTSFITYWLPSLLKYEHIALRFITQSSYEKAARMRVSPTPDIVTRVFMLFRGVRADDVGLWAPAAARAATEDGATFWSNVVGVDTVRASDRTLFRVLEWGGMEVQ